MSDHHDPSNDRSNDPSLTDERIDALARAAGSQLRRPAPADGIARVQRARRRRRTAQLGGAGVAAVAILAVGAFTIGGNDAGPTVVPATVSTIETPDTTVPTTGAPESTVPDTTDASPPTSQPPDTPGSIPPNDAGSPDVVYTATDFASMVGTEVSTVDPRTGTVLSTTVVDDAASVASRAAQDALLGRTSLVGVRRETGGDWFTTDYAVGPITYSVDALPSEVGLDGLSDDALALFDRCGMSGLEVTGADASALPERLRSLVISADGRRMVVIGGECPVPGTLADGNFDGRFQLPVLLLDATRPDESGRVLIEGISGYDGALQVSFSPDGRFVAVQSAGEFFGSAQIRYFDAATGEQLPSFTDDCSVSGTRWSRFIGPWIGDSSVALTTSCDGAFGLLVRDLATGEQLDVVSPTPEGTTFVSIDVDVAHYDRPSNAWFTICGGSAPTTCWLGQGDGELLELPGAVQASFLPLGFEYGG